MGPHRSRDTGWARPEGHGGQAASGLQPLACPASHPTLPCLTWPWLLPATNPCGFWVKMVADGFCSSDIGENKSVGISSASRWCQVLAESWKPALPLYLRVCADGFHLSWKQNWGSVDTLEPQQDFCSKESRCDDNHCHLKSSEA